jgi:hypothetical protein
MVLLLISWVISNSGNIEKHEELMRKLISCYQTLGEVKSYKYLSHWIGEGQSAGCGRLEIFEFENLAALDNFFEGLGKNKEASRILEEKFMLIDPSTVRFSLLSEKNRELWFERKEKS